MKVILKSLISVLFFSVVTVGCGRKGALESPSLAMDKTVQGKSILKREDDKPFILDRLIQ
ncbi:hypothetical protein [Bartonella raoultii]|uniref:Lipoprotein n=1 Tax=Bartonella raoultii TaxID=1457020 RepID=A0ABS7I538_9HYPH|nr:hypothetical protein [Bartonella raoultii]MBX4335958.1 hypothetical protein [Bartonella raoultii]